MSPCHSLGQRESGAWRAHARSLLYRVLCCVTDTGTWHQLLSLHRTPGTGCPSKQGHGASFMLHGGYSCSRGLIQSYKPCVTTIAAAIPSIIGRTNNSKSGPNDPTFFSWMGVHALMAVITLTLSLVKYLLDAVDFCETAQLPL